MSFQLIVNFDDASLFKIIFFFLFCYSLFHLFISFISWGFQPLQIPDPHWVKKKNRKMRFFFLFDIFYYLL
jgi:hypothetical protein